MKKDLNVELLTTIIRGTLSSFHNSIMSPDNIDLLVKVLANSLDDFVEKEDKKV